MGVKIQLSDRKLLRSDEEVARLEGEEFAREIDAVFAASLVEGRTPSQALVETLVGTIPVGRTVAINLRGHIIQVGTVFCLGGGISGVDDRDLACLASVFVRSDLFVVDQARATDPL